MPIFEAAGAPVPTYSMADRRSTFLTPPPQARAEPAAAPAPEGTSFPLGVARGQVASTYIVAEAEDGLVIVDQHPAPERLTLERSEARRVWQACDSTCNSRWSLHHYKTNIHATSHTLLIPCTST